MTSEELRAVITRITTKGDDYLISQRELSLQISYSATTLSLWLRSSYPHDAADLEAALRAWYHANAPHSLSSRDRRRSRYIQDLLDSADNKEALLHFTYKKNTTGRSTS